LHVHLTGLVYRNSSFAVFCNHPLVCLHFHKIDTTRRFILAQNLFSFFVILG
jgi:hypothetical protein